MFEKTVIEDQYCYVYKDKMDNGQTISFIFWEYGVNRNIYTVEMEIYSKRNKKFDHFLNSTGKCGLKGLLLARLVIECFIEFLAEITPVGEHKDIIIGASNNKRKRIYKHYLSKLGFEYQRTKFGDMGMCLEIEGKRKWN